MKPLRSKRVELPLSWSDSAGHGLTFCSHERKAGEWFRSALGWCTSDQDALRPTKELAKDRLSADSGLRVAVPPLVSLLSLPG